MPFAAVPNVSAYRLHVMNTPTLPASPTLPPPVASFRPRRSPLFVILSGMATTALALVGVYYQAEMEGRSIMGVYANFIIPAGPLLVGLVASSGYGIASWKTGVKITRGLWWTVVALMLAAYVCAQYIEFANLELTYENGETVGFLAYYDHLARSFAWRQADGSAGEPFGLLGYGMRALEVLGFIGGGLLVPLVLRHSAYCEGCQLYMRTKALATIPASVATRKIAAKDTAAQDAYAREQEEAAHAGQLRLDAMQDAAAAGRIVELQDAIALLRADRKATEKLPGTVAVSLVHCPCCSAGRMEAHLVMNRGNQHTRTDVGTTPLAAGMVQALRQSG